MEGPGKDDHIAPRIVLNRLVPPGVIGEVGDELKQLFTNAYPKAYRTAYLIMRDRQDAEEAVQEAFLRVWRFRDALPAGDAIHPWIYRVLVNTCNSQLRKEIPRRDFVHRDPQPECRNRPDSRTSEIASVSLVSGKLAPVRFRGLTCGFAL